jgi:hypothetical protein
MRAHLIAICAGALFVSGCEKLWSMMPRRATNVGEVQQTLARCGIEPNELYWRVERDGTFVYELGKPSPQMSCLHRWTGRHLIKTAYIIT